MITFGTTAFTLTQIQRGEQQNLSQFYKEAFDFCRNWTNGQGEFILQTSGSTGPPKEVTVSRVQLEESARATRSFFGFNQGCKMLCCLDTDKVAGKMMLVRAMEWDGDLRVIPPVLKPFEGLKNDAFDFVAMVPLQVEKSLASSFGRKVLKQIQNIIIGGAAISPQLRVKVSDMPGNIFQTYGMTETVSHIALANLKDSGPLLYKALPGVGLKVDRQNRLMIHAPMGGKTWLQTNDVVSLIGGNTFLWKGRADHVVNSGGVKLHPEEIATEISELMNLYFPKKLFFLTGRRDESLGESLALVIEGRKDAKNADLFLEKAKAILPKFHRPKQILFISEFQLTSSGKIDQIRTLAK